jgi:hypothetical protein
MHDGVKFSLYDYTVTWALCISCSKEQTREEQASAVQEDTPRKHHSVGQEWKGIMYEYNKIL